MFAAFSFEYGSVNKELQAQLAGKEEENSKLKLSIKELRKVMVDQARAAMAPAVTKTLNATDGNHLIEPRRRRRGSGMVHTCVESREERKEKRRRGF